MHQQEALQVTELTKGIVAGHGSLHPLLTTDPNTNVCSWKSRRPTDQNITINPSSYPWWQRWNLQQHLCLLLIMLTSLAPSPMDSVMAFLYFFTRLTTLAFCFGVTRQQMTASHSQAMFTKSICGDISSCQPPAGLYISWKVLVFSFTCLISFSWSSIGCPSWGLLGGGRFPRRCRRKRRRFFFFSYRISFLKSEKKVFWPWLHF